MIYRVHFYDDIEGSKGYRYHTNKMLAVKERNEYLKNSKESASASIDEVSTPKTKQEVVGLLNRWASHPDNG